MFGVVPLLISRGAGAEMRRTLGTAVFSGMLGVTFFGLLLTPVFFVVIDRVAHTKMLQSSAARTISDAVIGVLSLRTPIRLLQQHGPALVSSLRRPSPRP